MKWHIGMDVVCIKTHSKAVIKEGEVFTIEGIKKTCCSIVLDIGFKIPQNSMSSCAHCSKAYKSNGTWWFNEIRFAPLDSLTDISEIEEVLSKPAFEIN